MKTLYILLSHTITPAQKENAKNTLGVDRFIVVPNKWWGQIPADADSVCDYTREIESYLKEWSKLDDLLLVQGDFGATVRLVHFAQTIGMIPIYATTRRTAREVVKGEKITTVREFRHIRFRTYETECKEEK